MESQRSFSFVTWQIEKTNVSALFPSFTFLKEHYLKNIIRTKITQSNKLHYFSLPTLHHYRYNVSAVFPKCFMPLGCCLWCLFPIVYGGTYRQLYKYEYSCFNPGLLFW